MLLYQYNLPQKLNSSLYLSLYRNHNQHHLYYNGNSTTAVAIINILLPRTIIRTMFSRNLSLSTLFIWKKMVGADVRKHVYTLTLQRSLERQSSSSSSESLNENPLYCHAVFIHKKTTGRQLRTEHRSHRVFTFLKFQTTHAKRRTKSDSE